MATAKEYETSIDTTCNLINDVVKELESQIEPFDLSTNINKHRDHWQLNKTFLAVKRCRLNPTDPEDVNTTAEEPVEESRPSLPVVSTISTTPTPAITTTLPPPQQIIKTDTNNTIRTLPTLLHTSSLTQNPFLDPTPPIQTPTTKATPAYISSIIHRKSGTFIQWLDDNIPLWSQPGPHYTATMESIRSLFFKSTFHQDLFKGFYSLSTAIKAIHPDYFTISFSGYTNPIDWLRVFGQSNPCFTYENSPLVGWKREIIVSQGTSLGNCTVLLAAPSGRKVRCKGEVPGFLRSQNLSLSVGDSLDFRPVFCVCHKPQSTNRCVYTSTPIIQQYVYINYIYAPYIPHILLYSEYIECSYGRGGCNSWVHPSCVGLGHLSSEELEDIDSYVCPLCAYYMDGVGDHAILDPITR